MVQAAGISGGATGPWYRVQAVSASCLGGSADRDYAAILPAALNAAAQRRPFIAGWLSRGGGAPLELITNAGPLPGDDPAGRQELLFPWGAHGQPVASSVLADLDRLVWGTCPVRQAPLARPDEGAAPAGGTDPVRGRAADPDGPGLRLADRGRPGRAHRRRDRRAAVPAEHPAAVRGGAGPVRRRARAAPPGRAGRLPRGRAVGGPGAGRRGHRARARPDRAGAGRRGGPALPPVPAAQRRGRA